MICVKAFIMHTSSLDHYIYLQIAATHQWKYSRHSRTVSFGTPTRIFDLESIPVWAVGSVLFAFFHCNRMSWSRGGGRKTSTLWEDRVHMRQPALHPDPAAVRPLQRLRRRRLGRARLQGPWVQRQLTRPNRSKSRSEEMKSTECHDDVIRKLCNLLILDAMFCCLW